MPNITLSVDDTIIKKVKKIAIEKDTTMTAMIRGYLSMIAKGDQTAREQAVEQLESSICKYGRDMSGSWTREELHERS